MKRHLSVLATVFVLPIPTSGLFAAAQEEMAAEKTTFSGSVEDGTPRSWTMAGPSR